MLITIFIVESLRYTEMEIHFNSVVGSQSSLMSTCSDFQNHSEVAWDNLVWKISEIFWELFDHEMLIVFIFQLPNIVSCWNLTGSTLKEVIFANFKIFMRFYKNWFAQNFYLRRTNSRKLILARNTKYSNFQTFFKFMTKTKIQKHHFLRIMCLFCLKIHQYLS